ncbi:MAG: sorbosone dehydrogenase family protein [Alphaproteobacteria bacterium]
MTTCSRLLTVLLMFAIASIAYRQAGAAASEETPVLNGTAAFGDWTKDAPGVKRLIKSEDLPAPGATGSASNGPSIIKQPEGAWPKVPPGFTVSAFLTDLKEPRMMRLAPNGDIFLSESGGNRIRVIRASAGAAKADSSSIFVDGLDDRPYGIAFYPLGDNPQFVYIATEGKILRYPYSNGDMKARGPAQVIVPDIPEGHHWTRDITFTPDGNTMLVSVGSGSNDAEGGMDSEKNRADILAFNPDGSGLRIYASGLRNPVTIGFHPDTGDLWTTVNERDGFGDNLPPDYATRVTKDGFYGWPWYYIGAHQDPTYPGAHRELLAKVLTPDVLFQPHSAPLGFAVYTGKQFPSEYRGDLFVAFHGSWNRANRTGYKLVRVRLDHGKPTGEYDDFMTGFVAPSGDVWARPVGVAVEADGSLLMSDDASGTVWRIAYSP